VQRVRLDSSAHRQPAQMPRVCLVCTAFKQAAQAPRVPT